MGRQRAIALLLLGLLLAGCAAAEEPPETEHATPVQVAKAERAAIRRVVTAEGVIHPLNQSAIVPKISAPVRAFHAMKGDRVSKGQLLAELESRDLQAAFAEAKSNYEQAESVFRATTNATLPEELKKAQLDVDTAGETLSAAQRLLASRQELFREGAMPRRSVDEANVAYVQAKNQSEAAAQHLSTMQNAGRAEQIAGGEAQVAAAKARYEAAAAQLSYASIESPIDGVITDRPLYAGEMATPDRPVITVMDVSRVIARVNVANDQLAFLKVGQEASLRLQQDAEEVSGKVTVVSPALDPNSTTGEVWIEANNAGGAYHPGATVRVSIVTRTLADALVVPAAALLPSAEGGTVVFVVGPDAIAHQRKIEIGIRELADVQIVSGIEAGEAVVTAGGLGLEDGAKVKVEEK